MPWWIPALVAALCWGASYPLTERVLGTLSPPTMMVLYGTTNLIVFGSWSIAKGTFRAELTAAAAQPKLFLWMAALLATIMIANLGIMDAIQSKNATLAAMVEAAYVLFIPLFAMVITGSTGLTWVTAAGSTLIGAGVFVLARWG